MAETFKPALKYRIKPSTIKVNGFEIAAPMSESPQNGDVYWCAAVEHKSFCAKEIWSSDCDDSLWLSRGICHTTKEAAIAHAKAMLGIDPNGVDE